MTAVSCISDILNSSTHTEAGCKLLITGLCIWHGIHYTTSCGLYTLYPCYWKYSLLELWPLIFKSVIMTKVIVTLRDLVTAFNSKNWVHWLTLRFLVMTSLIPVHSRSWVLSWLIQNLKFVGTQRKEQWGQIHRKEEKLLPQRVINKGLIRHKDILNHKMKDHTKCYSYNCKTNGMKTWKHVFQLNECFCTHAAVQCRKPQAFLQTPLWQTSHV